MVGRPIVENCLAGYNSCVFAYGQSGSGKTHTVLGALPADAAAALPNQAGLAPRMFAHLFERIRHAEGERREGRELRFLCRVSCLEIYQEVAAPLGTSCPLKSLGEGTDAQT